MCVRRGGQKGAGAAAPASRSFFHVLLIDNIQPLEEQVLLQAYLPAAQGDDELGHPPGGHHGGGTAQLLLTVVLSFVGDSQGLNSHTAHENI